jgi:hypothetical protein
MATIPAKLFEPWGGYASAPEDNKQKFELKVGVTKEKIFPMSRWREAILNYLFGVWSVYEGTPAKICFGTIELLRDPKSKRYTVSGETIEEPPGGYYGNYSIQVKDEHTEVECALARFAKDDHMGQLCIDFRDGFVLMLWNKERRGEYGASLKKYLR